MTRTTNESAGLNDARSRHWLYGFNVVLMAVVALTLAGFVCYLTATYSHKFDCTSQGLYSLSPSTHKVLGKLDAKGEKYTLVNLFPSGSPGTKEGEQSQEVVDLLNEYAGASKNITVDQTGASQPIEDIRKKVRDLYAPELKPYEEAFGELEGVVTDVNKFLHEEAASIGAVAQKANVSAEAKRQAQALQTQFSHTLPAKLTEMVEDVRRETDSVLPDWSALKAEVASLRPDAVNIATLESVLGFFANAEQLKGSVAPEMLEYFKGAQKRFSDMHKKVADYKAKLDGLPELKVEGVLSALRANSVLIMGPKAAQVISRLDLFKASPGRQNQNAPSPEMFQGEQAISSKLFAMVEPEKVKVVFVTTSQQQVTTDSWSEAADTLKDNNFDVLEWSPPSPPQPGGPPPGDPNPPAQGKGVLWVVFAPERPDQRSMMMGIMPNVDGVKEALKKHLAAGGSVLFLAESTTLNGFMPGVTDGYAFNEELKPFGLQVKSQYAVVHQVQGRDPNTNEMQTMIAPYFEINRYEDHEITRPVQSYDSVFITGETTVVDVTTPAAKDAETAAIIKTPATEFWGESSMAGQPKYDADKDLPAPMTIAAVSTLHKGTKEEQRVGVIGMKDFAFNEILDKTVTILQGNTLHALYRFPGNREIFKNMVLWTAGYENMIAVSAKSDANQRIKDISPTALVWLTWVLLVTVLPLLLLGAGGTIWYLRRR